MWTFGENSMRLYRDGQISNHHKSCRRAEGYELIDELKQKYSYRSVLSFIIAILMNCGIVEDPLSMVMFGMFADRSC